MSKYKIDATGENIFDELRDEIVITSNVIIQQLNSTSNSLKLDINTKEDIITLSPLLVVGTDINGKLKTATTTVIELEGFGEAISTNATAISALSTQINISPMPALASVPVYDVMSPYLALSTSVIQTVGNTATIGALALAKLDKACISHISAPYLSPMYLDLAGILQIGLNDNDLSYNQTTGNVEFATPMIRTAQIDRSFSPIYLDAAGKVQIDLKDPIKYSFTNGVYLDYDDATLSITNGKLKVVDLDYTTSNACKNIIEAYSYITASALSDYTTSNATSNIIEAYSYITASALSDYTTSNATSNIIEAYGYITASALPDLSSYATITAIPSLSDYTTSNATSNIIKGFGYITSSALPSLADYTTSNVVRNIINSCNYITSLSLPSLTDYTTSNVVKSMINNGFIQGNGITISNDYPLMISVNNTSTGSNYWTVSGEGKNRRINFEDINCYFDTITIGSYFQQPRIIDNGIEKPLGEIYLQDNYYYYAFTSTGTNYISFNQRTYCDVLVLGGGGKGYYEGGGGSSGGLVYLKKLLIQQGDYQIVVGNKGDNINQGGISSVFDIVALGGSNAINMNGATLSTGSNIIPRSYMALYGGEIIQDLIADKGGGSYLIEKPSLTTPIEPSVVSGSPFYYYYVFNSTNSITFNTNTNIDEMLVVGGGGSGSASTSGGSSGGSGGVFYSSNINIPAGTYPIVVGEGGINSDGGLSSFIGAVSTGGKQGTTAKGGDSGISSSNLAYGGIIKKYIETPYFGCPTFNYYTRSDFYSNTTNMKVWYRFNGYTVGNTTYLNDSSGNNKTLTPVGTFSSLSNVGLEGDAGQLVCCVHNSTSSSSYMELNEANYANSTNMSVCIWVQKVSTPTTVNTIVSANTASNGWRIFITAGNVLTFSYGNGTGMTDVVIQSSFIVAGVGKHIAVSFNSSSVKCYVDGAKLVDIVPVNLVNTASAKLRIFADKDGSEICQSNTRMDDLRIYTHIITAQDITAIRSAGNNAIVDTFTVGGVGASSTEDGKIVGAKSFFTDTTDMKVWYKFNSLSELGKDYSGNNKTLTLGVESETPVVFDTTNFKTGVGSAYFDKNYYELNEANYVISNNNEISISFWIKTGRIPVSANNTIMSSREVSSSRWGWVLYLETDNSLCTQVYGTNYGSPWAWNFALISNFINASSPTWEHIVIVINKTETTTNLLTYRNNVLVNTLSYIRASFEIDLTRSSKFRIGAGFIDVSAVDKNRTIVGNIDDVRIYTKAITTENIAELYNLSPQYYLQNTINDVKPDGIDGFSTSITGVLKAFGASGGGSSTGVGGKGAVGGSGNGQGSISNGLLDTSNLSFSSPISDYVAGVNSGSGGGGGISQSGNGGSGVVILKVKTDRLIAGGGSGLSSGGISSNAGNGVLVPIRNDNEYFGAGGAGYDFYTSSYGYGIGSNYSGGDGWLGNNDADNGLVIVKWLKTEPNKVATINEMNAIINTCNLTSVNNIIKDSISTSNLSVFGETTLNSNLTIKGHIIPKDDIQYDLGSITKKWRDLYLSGDTIYLNNTRISSDPETNGVVIKDDANNITSITASSISLADPITGNVVKIEKTEEGIKFNEYTSTNEPVVSTTSDFVTSNVASNIIEGYGYITASALSDYTTSNATSNIIEAYGYITASALPDLSPYALITSLPDLSPYALTTSLPDLSPYALTTSLPDLSPYTTSNATSNIIEAYGYITSSSLPDLSPYTTSNATSNIIEAYGYITSSSLPDLSPYALTTSLPDLSPYTTSNATSNIIEAYGYITSSSLPDLSPYALTTSLPDLSPYTTSNATSYIIEGYGYITESSLPNLAPYALKTENKWVDNTTYISNGNVKLYNDRMVMTKSTQVDTAFRVYPPTSLTSTTTNISGLSYGNGTYIISSSGNMNITNCFNKYIYDFTTSSPARYEPSYGFYMGANYLGAAQGDYIILQLPVNIKLSYFNIFRYGGTYETPTQITMLGSTNGSTWTVLKNETTYYSNNVYTSSSIASSSYYNYFGLVVRAVQGSGMPGANVSYNIGEIELYGCETSTVFVDNIEFKNNGNCGIGKINALVPLDVVGDTYISGNVGIGKTSTSYKLDVEGNCRISSTLNVGNNLIMEGTSPTIILRDSDNRSGMIHMNGNLMYFLNGSGNNSETWAQQANGRWAMTINMNNNNIEAGGTIYAFGLMGYGNLTIGAGSYTNTITVNTNGLNYQRNNSYYFSITSDERIKEDIEVADYELCYNNISNLPLKRYKFKDGVNNTVFKDKHKLGYIAQEVQAIFPKNVEICPVSIYNSSNEVIEEINDCLSIDIDQIQMSLYGAFKHAQKKIEYLEAENRDLKNNLNMISGYLFGSNLY